MEVKAYEPVMLPLTSKITISNPAAAVVDTAPRADGDTVTLSDRARRLLTEAPAPSQEDLDRFAKRMTEPVRLAREPDLASLGEGLKGDYNARFTGFVRKLLGLSEDEGVTLTGAVAGMLKNLAAKAGIEPPEDEEVKEEDAGGVSMIEIHFSDRKGGGSAQIMIDENMLSALAEEASPLNPYTSKRRTVNLTKPENVEQRSRAQGLKDALREGPFGDFWVEKPHKSMASPTAQSVYAVPDGDGGERPLFLMQTEHQNAFVRDKAGDVFQRLAKALSGAMT